MLKKQSTFQSKVFRDFKTLDKRNYHAVVRFYEQHQQEIPALDFDESFVLKLHYCNALFEIGQYERQLSMANFIIECSILNNIQYYQGEDIYLKTLFQKAKSLYLLGRFSDAEYILKELIKLSPNHKSYLKLLRQCFSRSIGNHYRKVQIFGSFIFLIGVLLLVINILYVQHFYPNYSSLLTKMWLISAGVGFLLMIIGTLAHLKNIERRVKQFQQKSRDMRLSRKSG